MKNRQNYIWVLLILKIEPLSSDGREGVAVFENLAVEDKKEKRENLKVFALLTVLAAPLVLGMAHKKTLPAGKVVNVFRQSR